jgi:hypothetical protein
LRDGSGLRGKVFCFGSKNVGAKSRSTDAQIEAARECLKGTGVRAAQAARWFAWQTQAARMLRAILFLRHASSLVEHHRPGAQHWVSNLKNPRIPAARVAGGAAHCRSMAPFELKALSDVSAQDALSASRNPLRSFTT